MTLPKRASTSAINKPVASQPSFILASASPRRLELLAQIGLVPSLVIPAEMDETPRKNEKPEAYVSRMAAEKAAAVTALHPEATILAADTIVCCGTRILGKPTDESDARRMLTLLSGRRHRVYTAIALHTPTSQKHKRVLTVVQFKHLHQNELTAYLATNEWQGKAGSYAIQGHAAAFIPRINGSYSNVVGLPLAETSGLLTQI